MKEKKPVSDRSFIAKQNQMYGASFENLIKEQCEAYFDLKIAEIHKEEGKQVKNSHKLREKLTVDFKGWCIKNGSKRYDTATAVGIECKSVGDTWNLNTLKEHQLEYLHRLSKNGGVALILLEFRNKSQIWKIPINKHNYNVLKEKKSIRYEQINELLIGAKQIKSLNFLD